MAEVEKEYLTPLNLIVVSPKIRFFQGKQFSNI